MKTNNKGFSLVELIVVIAIMAILAAVAIPTFAGFINKANVASDESFDNDVEYAIKLAHTAWPSYEVTGLTITPATSIVYTVGDYTVTIPKTGTVTVTLADGKTADATMKANLEAAGAEVQACTDWEYTYKSK